MTEQIDDGLLARKLKIDDELLTQEFDVQRYTMTPRVQLFIDDMAKAICYTDNCEYKMESCKHKRLAVDLMKAVIDYHANLLDSKNHVVAATILRSEM